MWRYSKRERERERLRMRRRVKGEKRHKVALSCSLVLKKCIYFPLISNSLVNFLSLFIASTWDLSLAAYRKTEKVQRGKYRRVYVDKLSGPGSFLIPLK